MSVMLTRVLLKVARMFATPLVIFFPPFALMIFLPARSSASSSAAVGAATAGAAPSTGLGASAAAAGAVSAGAGAAPFFPALAGAASPAGFPAGFAAVVSLASFLGFFFSSALDYLIVCRYQLMK